MKQLALCSCLLLGLTAGAAALDLTPHVVTTLVGDYEVRRVCFLDGEKKYAVTLDGETELTGHSGAAIFNFTKFPRAVMRVTPSPLKPEVGFEGETLDQYRTAATELLLRGAEQPVLEKEDADVLPVNHWTSRRFTFVYRFVGTAMRESVTFLNFDGKQQFVLQTRALEKDFAAVAARADDIFRRWHEFRPQEAVEGN
ncbi:MAG: hypothetical protein K8R23_11110 [Chthoniobacter sp.]|nr:hypothetical protein [Chthoniobacter sp.]